MHLYQTDIWVRYARRGKPHNPKEVGHPFPIMCMFYLSDEITFHGNFRYEGNGCLANLHLLPYRAKSNLGKDLSNCKRTATIWRSLVTPLSRFR